MEIQVSRRMLLIMALIVVNIALICINFFGGTEKAPRPAAVTVAGAEVPKHGRVMDEPVLALAQEGDTLWAGTPYGLYRVEGDRAEKVLPEGKEDFNVHSLYVRRGRLYLGYTKLPVVKDESGWRFMPREEGEDLAGTAILQDGGFRWVLECPAWDFTEWQGRVYAVCNQGVFDLETGQRVGPPTEALGFAVFGGDHLYAGTFDGVWRYDREWEHVLDTGELKVTDITRLGGSLYAAVPAEGLYESSDGRAWGRMVTGEFTCVVPDAVALFLCAPDGAYVYEPDGRVERITDINEPVMSIATGDSLWIGTDRALYLLPGR